MSHRNEIYTVSLKNEKEMASFVYKIETTLEREIAGGLTNSKRQASLSGSPAAIIAHDFYFYFK